MRIAKRLTRYPSQDQYDVIDFTDNEIRVVENFPRMQRLRTLFISNNYVSRISDIGGNLTGLTTLMLSNNRIAALTDIDNIATLTKLENLSLLENPVIHLPKYRLYVIFKIPSLKSLDFQKVRKAERELAHKFFSSAAGREFLGSINSIVAQGVTEEAEDAPSNVRVLTEEQKAEVRQAIQNATTRDEVDKIERQLRVRVTVFSFSSVNIFRRTALFRLGNNIAILIICCDNNRDIILRCLFISSNAHTLIFFNYHHHQPEKSFS